MPVEAVSEKAARSTAAARQSAHPKPPAVRAPIGAAAFGAANVMDEQPGIHGHASFYGSGFQGRRTATGERFDRRQFTAASNRFPLGTRVAVRREDNGRCAIVKVNDRMHARHKKRVIDVSRSVAEYLGMVRAGVVFVRVSPLKGEHGETSEEACLAAFDPDVSRDADGQPEKMPEFLPIFGG